jgi:GAF domain-containing protein
MENFVLSCRKDTDISIYSLYSRPYNSLNMAEELRIKNGDKQEMYETLLPQIASLVGNETDLIANMANVAAALKQTFGFFWVGFYRVIDNQLVLAPFQGPIACTRIKYGKGVCGTAWKETRTIIVPDVDAFPGHIACSSASRSEIVVPVIWEDKVIAVLDIDSDKLDSFNETDQIFLEKIVELLPHQ